GAPPDARHTGGLGAGSDPVAAPARGTPVGAPLLHSDPVAAGKNLFASKAAPTPARRRLGIIPIALAGGLVLASAGGYYVWREISPQPVLQRPSSAPRPAPHIVQAVAPAPALEPAAVVPAPETPPAPSASEVAAKKVPAASPKPAGHIPQAAAAKDTQPINIERVKESDTVDPTLLAGYQAYRNGDLRTARQHYSDVLGKDAKNRDALLGLAAIAQQQSEDDVAARYYRQVLVLDPRDPVANAGMSVLFGASNAAGTESRLKGLIAQYPQSSALHFALGSHYAEQLRWGEAQQAFFNACNLEPDNAQFAFNLAVSLDHLGQGKLAAQHYRRALQLDSSGGAGIDRAQTQKRLNELTAP
ncbi:MAG: tetratricopeptide repeat protein, partial [Gallionellaceae bacterium]|nr:tetratricopeptide repeat protein [Gallionellaceae bacterium]